MEVVGGKKMMVVCLATKRFIYLEHGLDLLLIIIILALLAPGDSENGELFTSWHFNGMWESKTPGYKALSARRVVFHQYLLICHTLRVKTDALHGAMKTDRDISATLTVSTYPREAG